MWEIYNCNRINFTDTVLSPKCRTEDNEKATVREAGELFPNSK